MVKGAPDRYRDFVYIEDVVDAYMCCLDNPASFGKIYNVACGEKTYVKHLLEAEIRAFGYDPLTYPVRFQGSTPGDTFGIYADISRIKKDLAWQPRVSLNEGLARMAAWALSTKKVTVT